MNTGHTYSSALPFLEGALQIQSDFFNNIVEEMSKFIPRTEQDIREKIELQFSQSKERNSPSSWQQFIDKQVEAHCNAALQFQLKFHDRFMSQAVGVIVQSATLCEATINAVVAIGLVNHGQHELFDLFDRADLKTKWLIGPKLFNSKYVLPKGEALYCQISDLVKLRNSFVHHKIAIVGHPENSEIRGSPVLSLPMNKSTIRRVKGFADLPYLLHDNFLRSLEAHDHSLFFESILRRSSNA